MPGIDFAMQSCDEGRMSYPHSRVCALVGVLLVAAGSTLFAQTADLHTVYLAGRLGANLEATDPGTGSSIGAGGSFGFFFTERWAIEIEAWIPAYITDQACGPPVPAPPFLNTPGACGPGQFRDLQFAVSAVRHFGANGVHPYVLVGAAKLWTQSRTPLGNWTNSESVYPQGGVGLVIPVSKRLALVPEVRVDYLFLGAILRPNVTVVCRLH
jgi:hypothetical protein